MSDTEVHDNIPQENQENPTFFGMRMGVNISDANFALLDKITPEHMDKMIDASASDEQAKRKIQSRRQWLNLVYAVLAMAVFVFLIIFLRSDTDLLVTVITIAVSFLGGLGTGFTLFKRKNGD